MARFELKLPKMGESVAEATITSWLKEVGDTIELDETIVEIATDKVDSEVPSEVEGTLIEILFEKDDVVAVGATIAVIETEVGDAVVSSPVKNESSKIEKESSIAVIEKTIEKAVEVIATPIAKVSESGKFYSPLVRNIAKKEEVSMNELEAITGSGKDDRVTKEDILSYIKNREKSTHSKTTAVPVNDKIPKPIEENVAKSAPVSVSGAPFPKTVFILKETVLPTSSKIFSGKNFVCP